MWTPTRTRVRVATAVIATLVATVGLGASPSSAGQPSRWTQITHAHNGAKSNLGLARGKGGVLHVLWAGPTRPPFTAISDTSISPAGVAGKPQAVISGWNSVQPPAAAAAPDGSVHVVISGQKVLAPNDPYAGLNEAVGPGSWSLGAAAFGTFQLTVASSADVSTAMLKSGQLINVWRSATSLLFQAGVDASTKPQNITPPGLSEAPVVAVDGGSGEAIVAYRDATSGGDFFRRLLPSLGALQAMPQAKVLAPTIAARVGGGVFSAYTPDGTKVWLLRFGGKATQVPVPNGTQVLTAGLAAGPDGRLWIFYGNEQHTYVTRSSKRASGFEPVQTLASPPKTAQLFRLEGEGSTGPLDLFADVTVDGAARDGSYQTHVFPVLSLRVAKSSGRLIIRVTDAGDPVQDARVAGLPGGERTTDTSGSIVVTVPGGHKSSFVLSATKEGYLPARGKVSS
jgi:hypothetical protein